MNYAEFDPTAEDGKENVVLHALQKSVKKRAGQFDPELVVKQTIKNFILSCDQYLKSIEKNFNGDEFKNGVFFTNEATNNNQPDGGESNYFLGKLHPYQCEGLAWLKFMFKNSMNGILGDEMGLGKTVQVIALFSYLYEINLKGPFVIIIPFSTMGNWLSEFKRFAPSLPVVKFHGSPEERHEQKKLICKKYNFNGKKVEPIVICSYNYPHMEKKFFRSVFWKYIVLDEGHRLKNRKNKIAKKLIAMDIPHKLILTGTPLQNNICELFTLFDFLLPNIFDIDNLILVLNPKQFTKSFNIIKLESETSIIRTIHKVISRLMIRREKKDVLSSLVPKKETIVYCPLTDVQKQIYRFILQEDLVSLRMTLNKDKDQDHLKRENRSSRRRNPYTIEHSEEDLDISRSRRTRNPYTIEHSEEHLDSAKDSLSCVKPNIYNLVPNVPYRCNVRFQSPLMELRKVAIHPYLLWTPLDPQAQNKQVYIDENLVKNSGKFLVLDALLKKLKKYNHKVLVFSNFVMALDFVEEYMILRNYRSCILDGTRNTDDRNKAIDDFNNDKDIFVFLLTSKAGGEGLNLAAADTVIFIDRVFNPMVDLQAMSRCHRIGQTKPVNVYSLVAQNTVDEYILECSQRKTRLESIIIEKGKFSTGKFVASDLKELEKLLINEQEIVKIRTDGKVYTDSQLERILERTEPPKKKFKK